MPTISWPCCGAGNTLTSVPILSTMEILQRPWALSKPRPSSCHVRLICISRRTTMPWKCGTCPTPHYDLCHRSGVTWLVDRAPIRLTRLLSITHSRSCCELRESKTSDFPAIDLETEVG